MSADRTAAALPAARTVLLVAGALVAAVVVTGLVTSVDPHRWDLAALGPLTYLLAGGMAFLEVGTPVGLVLPSELAVPVAGAAAAAGAVALLPLVGVVWACTVLGDSAGFLTGRLVGARVLARLGARRPHLARHRDALVAHFADHGVVTVVCARWLPYARTATPLVAGASDMAYRRFLAASVVGAGAWSLAMCTLGFVAYRSVATATQWSGRVGLLLLAAAVVVSVRRRRRRRALQQPATVLPAG